MQKWWFFIRMKSPRRRLAKLKKKRFDLVTFNNWNRCIGTPTLHSGCHNEADAHIYEEKQRAILVAGELHKKVII